MVVFYIPSSIIPFGIIPNGMLWSVRLNLLRVSLSTHYYSLIDSNLNGSEFTQNTKTKLNPVTQTNRGNEFEAIEIELIYQHLI